jgi:hypothetical protein
MNAVAVVEQNPAELIRVSTDVAGVCKEIVVKTACQIQGRKYVKVEGWQAIATAHGCILGSRDVTRIDGGVRAIGELRRISDGVVIATAEGFLGDDEGTWKNRAEYAKRAMAQTRSMSRVARSAFAHVVVMMDAGLETTPAEEMPHDPERTTQAEPAPMREDGRRAAPQEDAKAPPAPSRQEPWEAENLEEVQARSLSANCRSIDALRELKDSYFDRGGKFWTPTIRGIIAERYKAIAGEYPPSEEGGAK